MANKSVEVSCALDASGAHGRIEQTEFGTFKNDFKDVPGSLSSPPPNDRQVNLIDLKDQVIDSQNAPINEDRSGDVNMEASISSDDVIRAGGFGARDDIGSFLPVASDSTDFEATIRDARDYEEQQSETCRPGLGWAEANERK